MKRQTLMIVCLVVLVAVVAGGYGVHWLWWNATHYEVTRTEYHEPPRQEDVLVDDKPEVTGALAPTWTHLRFASKGTDDLDVGHEIDDWTQWRTVLELVGAPQLAAVA